MSGGKGAMILLGILLFFTLSLSPVSGDYPTFIQKARECFESGRHQECDSLLTELRSLKLKRLQRRKVCTLWLDNTYHTGRHAEFLNVLNSKYVKRNLDRSDYEYWINVSKIPPMDVIWPDKTEQLPLRTIGPRGHSLYGVDVMVNGTPLLGMIDNCCCNYCSISTELAERLGVRPIGKTIRFNGNRRSKAFIGVVDSLSLGNLIVRNVLVDVSDHLTAVRETHALDIIIGGNVLRRVGDMTIDNEAGTVSFSNKTLGLPQNVFWTYEGHEYYVKGVLNDHPVTMLFDTGNTNTIMSGRYLDRFPSDNTYREGTLTVTQVDRTWETKVYVIDRAGFELCGEACELFDVSILLEGSGAKRFDGNLGVDVLRQFKTIIFNANKLYLQLNK
ncbi:MAG: aspartyl protease family protein [Bacteroidales bacterium]|nr:aspartyl protease family protein [Bacteroidales bacterium]